MAPPTSRIISSFDRFPELPAEIRIQIWAHASDRPRNFGLWPDFQRREVDNIIFYTQLYESRLSTISPSPILQTSRESRAVALKYFQLGFETHQPIKTRPSNPPRVYSHPGFYVNFKSETICPRGNWNIISMEDFILRRARSQLRSLAMDITTDFYEDLYKDYILKNGWPFEIMEEVILYNAEGMAIFKKGYNGGKVELDFIDVKKPTAVLESAKDRLCGIFAEIKEKARVQREKSEPERGTTGLSATVPSFKQPRVIIMELVVRI